MNLSLWLVAVWYLDVKHKCGKAYTLHYESGGTDQPLKISVHI